MKPQAASRTVSEIPELLHLIVGELSLETQSLACLARVSTVLHQISIPYLWSGHNERPFDLTLLLRLLPKALLGHPEVPGNVASEYAPEEPCFGRFRHYSLHTLSLHLQVDTIPMALLLANRHDPLFPQLHTLVIDADSNKKYPFSEWMLLAGSSLRHLRVNGSSAYRQVEYKDDPNTYTSFYQHLRDLTPNLRHLSITSFPASLATLPVSLEERLCTTLRALVQLRGLHYTSKSTLSKSILTAIATHPSIRDVSLVPLYHWPTISRDLPRFPSLERVRLECSTDVGAVCVEALSYPQLLSSIDIHLTYEGRDSTYIFTPPDPQGEQVTQALQVFQPFSRLLQLSTELTSVSLNCGWQLVSWVQLQPLLDCKLITKVVIGSANPLAELNDGAVKAMAQSWPGLEELRFTLRVYPPMSHGVSLYGLMPLAQLTPKLRKLCIGFTTRVLDQNQVDSFREFRPTLPSPFCVLDVDDSEINMEGDTPTFLGPRRVASVITTLWPSLPPSGVSFMGVGLPAQWPPWEKVNLYMRARESTGESILVV